MPAAPKCFVRKSRDQLRNRELSNSKKKLVYQLPVSPESIESSGGNEEQVGPEEAPVCRAGWPSFL